MGLAVLLAFSAILPASSGRCQGLLTAAAEFLKKKSVERCMSDTGRPSGIRYLSYKVCYINVMRAAQPYYTFTLDEVSGTLPVAFQTTCKGREEALTYQILSLTHP